MSVSLAAAGINWQCLSIKKDSICFKQAVRRIWKICQSFKKSNLVDKLRTAVNLDIEEAFHSINDKTDDCSFSYHESDHLIEFDPCNNTQNANSTKRY